MGFILLNSASLNATSLIILLILQHPDTNSIADDVYQAFLFSKGRGILGGYQDSIQYIGIYKSRLPAR